MRYAVHHVRRPGPTRDLPYGPEDLFWVVDTATLIYGDHDAVLIDTYATVEQNEALITTAEELYGAMLERYPRRANPGSLWGGAKRAKQSSGN